MNRLVRMIGLWVLAIMILCPSGFCGENDSRQNVFVEPAQHQMDAAMGDALEEWGRWRLVGDVTGADLLIRLHIREGWRPVHIRAFVIDAKTKETIWVSKNRSAAFGIFHGQVSPYARCMSLIMADMKKRFGEGGAK